MREHPNESTSSLHILLPKHASLQETLRAVAAVAVRSLDAAMAGLTLLDAEGRATTAVFTDDVAPEIDQAQYASGRGPCLDAFRLRTVFRVDSTDDDGRWPEFAATARANGIQSSLSLPLVLEGQGIGALNLYAPPPRNFDSAAEATGTHFAAEAAVAVANGVAYWEKATLADQLRQAMESRAEIEQAKGVIMSSSGCTPDEAFRVLREQSQAENIKIRDIAAKLVEQQKRGRPQTG